MGYVARPKPKKTYATSLPIFLVWSCVIYRYGRKKSVHNNILYSMDDFFLHAAFYYEDGWTTEVETGLLVSSY